MPKLPGVVRLSVLVVLAGGLAHDLTGQTPPQGGASPSAQQAYQKAPTGFILGQVLDAGTGQPIPGATVTLGGATPVVLNGTPVLIDDPGVQEAIAAARNANRLMTGASGQYVFHDLRAGNYRLTATAPGYVPGLYGQRRVNGNSRTIQLAEDQHVGDAMIKLWRYASLSGRVLDDIGEPVVGTTVTVLRVQANGARRTFQPGQRVQTDDRGLYRVGNLVPGDYVVAIVQALNTIPNATAEGYRNAMMSGSGQAELLRELSESGVPFVGGGGIRVADFTISTSGGMFQRSLPIPTPADPDRISVYQSVYYPAATTSVDATVLTLASGQDQTGIDLQLRLVPTVKVSGTVTGPDGPAKNTGVRLLPATQALQFDTGFEAAQSVTDANGAFTFLGVPSGQYKLKVQRIPRAQTNQNSMVSVMTSSGGNMMGMSFPVDPGSAVSAPAGPGLFGQAAVAVGERDVENVAVLMRTGASVSGRLAFEGSATPPTPDMLSRVTVTLTSIDGAISQPFSPAHASADGSFTTPTFQPGRYFINANGPLGSWTLRSATLGGRNLDDSPLELESDNVTGVVLTFSDQSSEVKGTVHTNGGAPVDEDDVTVFAFPANYSAWIDQGMTNRRQRSAPTAKSGVYTLTGLPAGEYLVVAVNSDTLGSMRDLSFFDTLARAATHVTLSEAEKRALDLSVSSIR